MPPASQTQVVIHMGLKFALGLHLQALGVPILGVPVVSSQQVRSGQVEVKLLQVRDGHILLLLGQ